MEREGEKERWCCESNNKLLRELLSCVTAGDGPEQCSVNGRMRESKREKSRMDGLMDGRKILWEIEDGWMDGEGSGECVNVKHC